MNCLYQKYQHNEKANLALDHSSYFYGDTSKILPDDNFNKKQHFLIVTNGVDQATIESIIYWKNSGLNIDAIVYCILKQKTFWSMKTIVTYLTQINKATLITQKK